MSRKTNSHQPLSPNWRLKEQGEISYEHTETSRESLQKGESPETNFQQFFGLDHLNYPVYNQEEQGVRLEIKAILEELKRIAKSTKKIAKEVEIAIEQVPVNPGIYHINFLKKLREQLTLYSKRIDESATWLAIFNQRTERKRYWGQVRRSGSKFMLSSERRTATQTA